MAGDENRGGQRSIDGACLLRGGKNLGWGGAAQRPVRAVVVVVLTELVEQFVEFGEGGRCRAGGEPFLQGLPEPFDLAAGLRMIRRGVDGAHTEGTQVRLEGRLELAPLAGVYESIVAQRH